MMNTSDNHDFPNGYHDSLGLDGLNGKDGGYVSLYEHSTDDVEGRTAQHSARSIPSNSLPAMNNANDPRAVASEMENLTGPNFDGSARSGPGR